MTKAREIIEYMESLRDEEQRENLMRFFKTEPGEYGYGGEFLGIKVPQTREIVKEAKDTPIGEIPTLLRSKWHEVRLCGLLILVDKFEKQATKRLENNADAIKKRDEILTLYLEHAERANNWDLVDLTAPKILGHWLLLPSNLGDRDHKIKVLDSLAASPCLWRQRMSIVCTWYPSHHEDPLWCLRYAEIHLRHPHDLMHKAVGWMLREMGKCCSMDLLRDFLRQHVHEMPRTTLRYAIEKMTDDERKYWMSLPVEEKPKTERTTKTNPFAGIAIPDFVDIILQDREKADEAMYYLLHHRLCHLLRQRYETVHSHLYDDFDDIVEDFFLYLREGSGGRNRLPYQALQRIKKKDSFESWLLNTFRNYLSNRIEAEGRLDTAEIPVDHLSSPEDGTPLVGEGSALCPSPITDEQKITVASRLIAYAHQMFFPRGRFIFLRTLLTMLNRQKALPDREMAEALGMTHLAYRVTSHRMKANLAKFRLRLLQGEPLRLDDTHEQMARQISDDFTHLYPTLLTLYTQTIGTMKCADAIQTLRQQHYEQTGTMLHEPGPADHPVRITVTAFWNKLSRLLIL